VKKKPADAENKESELVEAKPDPIISATLPVEEAK